MIIFFLFYMNFVIFAATLKQLIFLTPLLYGVEPTHRSTWNVDWSKNISAAAALIGLETNLLFANHKLGLPTIKMKRRLVSRPIVTWRLVLCFRLPINLYIPGKGIQPIKLGYNFLNSLHHPFINNSISSTSLERPQTCLKASPRPLW